jgi:hypothetical protein
VVVEFVVELDVGTERVAVRSSTLAVRVKYTERSWLSQVAGAVTVAPPRGLNDISYRNKRMLRKQYNKFKSKA